MKDFTQLFNFIELSEVIVIFEAEDPYNGQCVCKSKVQFSYAAVVGVVATNPL